MAEVRFSECEWVTCKGMGLAGLSRSLGVVKSKEAFSGDDEESKLRGGSVNDGVSADGEARLAAECGLCRRPSM